jgi:hypothetical protein
MPTRGHSQENIDGVFGEMSSDKLALLVFTILEY